MMPGLQKLAGKLGTRLLVLIAALLPWQARYIAFPEYIGGAFWEYGTLSVYALDVLILVTAILGIVYSWGTSSQKTRRTLLTGCIVLIYLFILSSITPNTITALTAKVQMLSAFLLFMSLLLLPWKQKPMLYALMFAGAYSSLLAIAQFFSGAIDGHTLLGIADQQAATRGVSVVETTSARFLRAYGPLPHPNMLGGFLLVTFFSGMRLLYEKDASRIRPIIVGILLVMVMALFFTFSRSALLGMLIGFLIMGSYMFIKGSGEERRTTLLVCIAICMLMVILGSSTADVLKTRISPTRLEVRSLSERVESIAAAQELILERPLIGTGYNAFTEALARRDNYGSPAWSYQPAHIVPLHILAETGFIGVSMALFILGFLIRSLMTIPSSSGKITLIAGIIGLAVISLFDHYLISSHFGLLLIVLTLFLPFRGKREVLTNGAQVS